MRGEHPDLARVLRRQMTSAEKVLWFKLRNRKPAGAKFRRQQPFGPYVLDFYCAEHKLNVELDGGQHDLPEQREHDRRRADFLAREGVTTLRFWNSQIRKNLEGVLVKIRMTLETLSSIGKPAPSESGTDVAELEHPHPSPLP
ncbi:MAG: endonuclease domain-containing protein [Kiritimatiellaeota bacterium]|nr:endonuclease domain-containing protein [Kiritimatiellota bacterium]